VGSPKENPCRITSHDLMTGRFGFTWHQHGVATASQAIGRWKIEFVEDGQYSITLRRFPRESGLAINATFPAEELPAELDKAMPAAVKTDFFEAYLYVANLMKTKKIEEGQAEVTFTGEIPAGKYDMEALLIDADNRIHPAYYVYIEKL
jgi:hypothetical protein